MPNGMELSPIFVWPKVLDPVFVHHSKTLLFLRSEAWMTLMIPPRQAACEADNNCLLFISGSN